MIEKSLDDLMRQEKKLLIMFKRLKKMKKYFLIAVSALALASCSNDAYLGDNVEETQVGGTGAISFATAMPNLQKATQVGATAATTLGNQFVVYGTKHASAEDGTATNDAVVFKNYVVEYASATAGTVASNSSDWDYVGKTPYADAKVSPATDVQTIKYWDYSAANGYTFYAFAGKTLLDAGKVTITKVTEDPATPKTVYGKGYTVNVTADADLSGLYYADRTPVAKANYGKPVILTFRSLGAKVRAGFYETVPGYKVKIDNFYFDTDASAAVTTFDAMDTESTTNFKASLQNVSQAADQTLTVTYYDNTDASIENHVKVTNGGTSLYTLTLGDQIAAATELATTSATPTWDKTGGEYTVVSPFEANTTPMLVKVDYTLTSEDNSGEVIHVKNARAVVPVQYVKWKANYAYTYIFKISNNTNGSTGTPGTDPEGLFPITFDAIAVTATDANQETVTTVATNAVTTYSKGSDVTVDNEYKNGTDIYVVNTNVATNAVIAPAAIGTAATNAQVYVATTTGDAISEASVKAKLTGANNGITLTPVTPAATLEQNVPSADGSNLDFGAKGAVKFTPGAAGTYVYVYTTAAYVAPTYTAVGSGTFDAGTTYYMKTPQDVYYVATSVTASNFDALKANLYTQTTAGTAGVYDVKVIKVI